MLYPVGLNGSHLPKKQLGMFFSDLPTINLIKMHRLLEIELYVLGLVMDMYILLPILIRI